MNRALLATVNTFLSSLFPSKMWLRIARRLFEPINNLYEDEKRSRTTSRRNESKYANDSRNFIRIDCLTRGVLYEDHGPRASPALPWSQSLLCCPTSLTPPVARSLTSRIVWLVGVCTR